eukprot:TRINITY_DN8026_c0_g1_i1.p1 TRINITY_DN8026_c0_g1~~TRINITY_DN8026_c0_g1_i1.p1  ORF type:complete len:400 (+),score=66.90 TRINITY_DN8026_c0_g1_i1:316-1515(+)
MNDANPENLQWLPPGVWHFAVQQLVAQAVILPLSGGIIKKLSPLQVWMAVATSTLSPLSIGIASTTGLFWLQYFGAAMAAFGFATALESDKVVALQWWAVDGSQAFGAAFQGGANGVSMLLFSLFLGVAGNAWGLALAAYAEAGLLVMMFLFPLWLALRGELGPPSPDLVAAMADVQQNQAREVPEGTKKTSKLTLSSMLRSVDFWQVAAHNFLYPFGGFGMKLLLTSTFQATYAESFLDSSILATGTIILFVAVRIAMPLISRLVPLMSVLTALLCINTFLYASYPSVIAHLSVWWLFAAKSIAGACFAGLNSLLSLLFLEVYSPPDLPLAFAATGPARALGFGLGPVVGYYIFLASQDNGIKIQESYNIFFYICAALALVAACNVVWLWRNLSQRAA